MNKLTHEEIRGAHAALQKVESVDKTIRRLCETAEGKHADWGGVLRKEMGSNLMHDISGDDLGQVVFCATVNELLRRRNTLAEDWGPIVHFPDPPCKVQECSFDD